MKHCVKALVILIFSLILLGPVASSAGTIDNASLAPPKATILPNVHESFSFSALNDKAFTLQNYYIKILYTRGLTITNLSVSPAAATASINAKKYYIELAWSNVAPGTELHATFDLSAGIGDYSLTPAIATYTDGSGNTFTVSCNSSTIAVKSDIVAPSEPTNIRSEANDGSITIHWDPPGDTDIASYKVYRRTSEPEFPANEYVSTTQTSYADPNIDANTIYYYAVSAVDTAGNESVLSIETADLYIDPISRRIDVSAIMERNTVPKGVAATGDLNGDGLEDLVLGFPDLNTNKKPGGRVVIYFGGNMTSEPDIQMYGGTLNDFFGQALAIVDLNNDGYDELIVGAPGFDAVKSSGTATDAGKIVVYAGGPQFDGIPLFTREGNFAYGSGTVYLTSEELGYAISPAGDVNGDGFQDVVISAPLGGYERAGCVYILYGGASISSSMNKIEGPGVWDEMGFLVAGVGDFNTDGYDDICAGNGENKIFLLLGGQTVQFSENTFSGTDENGRIAGGDFNGDGISDFVLSKPPYIGSTISRLEIFFGNPIIDYSSDAVIDYSTTGILNFQNYAGTLGDLDKDGTADILANGPNILWGNGSQVFVLPSVAEDQYIIGCGDMNNDGSKDPIAFDNTEYLITLYNVAPFADAPLVTIDAPADGYQSDTRVVEITGSIQRDVSKFTISGEQVQVSPQGSFSHTVYLKSESNLIECIAVSPDGMISKRHINIIYNIRPLTIEITSALTVDPTANTVEVTGTLSDALATVSVNGVTAQITDNSFSALVTIDGATTQITAQASDDFGQTATQSIDTNQLAPENQCSIAGMVTDAQGAPLPGATATLTDSLGLEYSTTTDASGKYHLFTPNSGTFTLSVLNSGWFKKTTSGAVMMDQTLFTTMVLIPLEITITAPSDGQTLTSTTISVSGTFNPDDSATITVNDAPASINGSLFNAAVHLVAGSNTITAVVADNLGQSAQDSVTVTVELVPPTITFGGMTEIVAGQQANLYWTVLSADTVTVDNGIGIVPLDMEVYWVSPLVTTTYTLTATGPGGTATASHTITVTPPPAPEATFQASPVDILAGESSTLTWNTTNAQTVTIDNGVGTVAVNGSTVVSPLATATYTLTATGISGTVTKAVTVTVTTLGPSISFNAAPATIAEGETATLSWEVTGADTVSIDNGIGTVSATGTRGVSPTQTTTYTLTATGAEGTTTKSVTVTVTPPKPIVELTASPGSLSVAMGGTVTLSWSCQLANSAVLYKMVAGNPLPMASGLTGIYSDQIDAGATYILEAQGPGGTTAKQANFTVWESVPIEINFQATPQTITAGQFINLTWTTSGATDVFIDNGADMDQQPVSESGTLNLAPLVTTTYVLTAYNQFLTGSSAYVTVVVSGDPPAPAINFSADPQGIFTGEEATLTWDVDYADTVNIDNGIGEVDVNGTTVVSPLANTTYTLTATGAGGTTTQSVTVTVIQPPTVTFTADLAEIQAGGTATLSWNVTGADAVSIDNGIGTVAASGTHPVTPSATTTYTLTATGAGGTTTQSVTVTVIQPPTVTFTADLAEIQAGGTATLSWNVTGADAVSIDNGIGTVAASGTHPVTPSATTTYTLTATGAGGTTIQSLMVTVNVLPQVQIFSDSTINAGDNALLDWLCSNADTCTITPGIGDVASSGSQWVSPEETTTYTLTATNAAGTSSANTVINVLASPTLTADRIIIDKGESATLLWTSTTAESCEIAPNIGAVPFSGELTVSPADTTLYTLTVHKGDLTAKAYVRIHVRNGTYYGNPTPAEQAHIEAINRARANPLAEAARLNIDLNEGLPSETISGDPVQPLACSTKLLESARLHSRDMIDNQYYAHNSLDGSTPSQRMMAAGFQFLLNAENLSMETDSRDPIDEVDFSLLAHEQLFVDAGVDGRGHRINILNPDLKEVGVGLSRGPYAPYAYSAKFTCDFGTSLYEMRSYLLGVVYDDMNGDGQYTAGEGVADAQILIVETGEATISASAGGYRIPLAAGDYTVRATLPDGRQLEKNFTISDQNVKVDFDQTPLPVIAFNATPGQFIPGEQATLTWTVTGADTVSIDQGIGTVLPSDSTLVTPTQETTYTLTATGQGGTTSQSVTLTMKTPVVVFTADPRGIADGEIATLSWNVTGADTVSIDQGIGTVATSDTYPVTPSATTTYTLTAQGPGGTTTATATVWLDTEAPAVIDITPAGGTVVESQNGWVAYTATVQDNASGLCSVTLLDDQGTDVSSLLEINGSEISWVYSGGGSAAFTLILEDCAGNSAPIAVNNTITTTAQDVDYGFDAQAGPDIAGGTIRITNGNVIEARNDFTVTTPNQLGLGFDAFYNSRSAAVTALGYGWTHTYSATLTGGVNLGSQTFIRIVDATGRARYFSDTSPYAPAFNEKSQLAMLGGQYVWQRLDGSRCGFNTDGSLDWIDDAAGNRLALAYDAGQLQTVTDTAGGRSLGFNYSGGLLVSVSGPVTDAVPDGVWVQFEHDGYQNLVSATYADGSAVVYTYAGPYDPHNLTRKEDGAGHQMAAWDYDDQDRAFQSRMPDDSSVQLDYLSPEQVQVTDAYGTARTYDLAQIHGRIKVTRLQGPAAAPYYDTPAVRWHYDDQLNPTEVEMAGGTTDSPMNTIHRNEDFDARGNPGTIIQAWNTTEERTIALTYHPVLNTVLTRTEASVMDEAQDKETIYDYDDPAEPGDDPDIYNENPTNLVHRIIEKGLTRAGGSVQAYTYVTTLTYNTWGQLLSKDGPLSGADDTTAYAYDPVSGDLISISRPLVGATTFGDHDAAGRPRTITDINSVAKSLTYDGRGRLVTILNQADGSSQNATYENGLLTQRTDADGITQSISYEPAYGRPDTITDHEGHTTVFGYDSYGNRTHKWRYAVDDPSTPNSSARWSYEQPDLPGRLYRAFRSDPNQPDQEVYTQYDYDLAGNTAAVTDPKGQTTSYVYDSLNRVIETNQPGGGTTFMGYDAHGNLIEVTDAEGRRTVYVYDDMGRKVSEDSPDAGATTFAYDAAGSLVNTIDGRGVSVAYTPDELGRTRRIDYPLYDGRPAYAVTYTYDNGPGGNGRLTAMTDASGSTSWDYSLFDAQGILTQNSVIDGFTFTVSETRTPGGRRTQLMYPSGRVVDYQRSQCTCSISGVTTTYGIDTATLLADIEYQPSGMPKAMDIGDSGAPNVDNHYDEAGRLTATNPGTPNARSYTHDANGNTIDIQMAATPWQGQTYTYDTLNRITGAVGDFGFIDMTYDKTGNRLTRTQNGTESVYGYVPGTNRLESLTPAGGTTVDYGYDGHGNMTLAGVRVFAYDQANRLVAVSEDGSTIGQYIYNGLGQRVVKTTATGTTYYHYDPAGKLIAEAPAGGAVDQGAEYIYKGNSLLAQVDVQNGAIYTCHTNYLGAVHQLTDNTGTVVWEAVYQPFGQNVINVGSTVVNNWRMPGQYFDEETGLSYNYHRYYDPALGRYLTPDPIGLEGGINLYAYVQNNPVNWVDPLGLWSAWFGGSTVASWGPWGGNKGGGIAYDSNNGGLGVYGTNGKTQGAAGSAGAEVGFFTGSMSGKTDTFSIGFFVVSVGFVTDYSDWGVVVGTSVGAPAEGTISENDTEFISFGDIFSFIFNRSSSNDSPCN